MFAVIDLSASILALTLAAPPDDSLAGQWGAATGAPAAAPATPGTRAKKCPRSKKKGKAKCRKPRKSRAELAVLAADARRREAIADATPLVSEGRYDVAAQALASAAESGGDPVLFLAAAEARLADQKVSPEELERAAEDARRAEALSSDPVQAKIAPQTAPRLVDHSQELTSFVGQRREGIKLHRRGRAELATGGVFVGLAVSGVALLAGGAVLGGRVADARESNPGPEFADYRASLEDLRGRSEAMLAAGLVTALAGAAIGVPLTIAGARDLKRAREVRQERPQFRIAPGFAGVSLSGRF